MTNRMMKSKNNRVLTGTLAGIAEYFGVDPTIARVIYVFASITLIGAPILLYILLSVLIPSSDSSSSSFEYYSSRSTGSAQPNQAETVADDCWGDF
ncbi:MULTISPECIES: PspC domain-containing protein [Enterococcus]|uniref:PspC domain-containing protein n=1 Tax=Candidatus Enterococcus murrayae TaxID=2815321 RepID=A0ABS3HE47_9ENTE|nr:PspC domain-containing protein [Enterococcus sp. MJM16]MBO0451277.1 PspC domain-containing protein [Enterococcus sp. MJM16]